MVAISLGVESKEAPSKLDQATFFFLETERCISQALYCIYCQGQCLTTLLLFLECGGERKGKVPFTLKNIWLKVE